MSNFLNFEKLDFRIAIVFVMVFIFGALVLAGDTYTFVKAPETSMEKVLTIPTYYGYQITGDRWSADGFSMVSWAVLIGPLALFSFRMLVKHVFEPAEVLEAMRRTQRRQNMMQKYRYTDFKGK